MSKAVFLIEGYKPSCSKYDDDNIEPLCICESKDAVKRGIIFYSLRGYENIDYRCMKLDDFQDININEIFYLYHINCYIKKNNTLGIVFHDDGKYTTKREETINWTKGRKDGEDFFEVTLELCLKEELPPILTKEHRKMIRDKIYELSEGEIKCVVPFEDIDLE